MNDDMMLPEGKSCADCRSFDRCRAFIGATHINDQATRCDWAPSKFVQRVPALNPAAAWPFPSKA